MKKLTLSTIEYLHNTQESITNRNVTDAYKLTFNDGSSLVLDEYQLKELRYYSNLSGYGKSLFKTICECLKNDYQMFTDGTLNATRYQRVLNFWNNQINEKFSTIEFAPEMLYIN